ncbi:MAG: hypothetical protein KKG59_04760 [Nanoarchaeota archaeon]|nr:hypothetical protein [Nanoarchaeota archaeon]
MKAYREAIYLLMGLNILFAILAFASFLMLHAGKAIISIGISYFVVDWFVLIFCCIAMAFIVFQIHRISPALKSS